MAPANHLPELTVGDAVRGRSWLAEHHGDAAGVWLVLAKKGISEPTSLTYDEALDDAICHGWIDGQKRSRDGATFLQRFTPRRARGAWSKRNAGIAERLITSGQMHPSGLAEVQRAKDDGRWAAAYEGQADMSVPDDFAAALAANSDAAAMFEILTSQNRYALLYRIHDAKRPDTRARRIEKFVAMLVRGETIYPQRRQQI